MWCTALKARHLPKVSKHLSHLALHWPLNLESILHPPALWMAFWSASHSVAGFLVYSVSKTITQVLPACGPVVSTAGKILPTTGSHTWFYSAKAQVLFESYCMLQKCFQLKTIVMTNMPWTWEMAKVFLSTGRLARTSHLPRILERNSSSHQCLELKFFWKCSYMSKMNAIQHFRLNSSREERGSWWMGQYVMGCSSPE